MSLLEATTSIKEQALEDKREVTKQLALDEMLGHTSAISKQLEKVRALRLSIKKKADLYFDKCVKAIIEDRGELASVYAAQLSDLRRMYKLTMTTELFLEQVMIRLDTLSEASEAVSTLSSVTRLLGQLHEDLMATAPPIALNLRSIADDLVRIKELSKSMVWKGLGTDFSLSEEAKQILEEAKRSANIRTVRRGKVSIEKSTSTYEEMKKVGVRAFQSAL